MELVPVTNQEVHSTYQVESKCEFCDVTFKSDLDVIRHTLNPTHSANRDKFMSQQRILNKEIEKQIPKNLATLMKSLRIRKPIDLQDLADKGYFEIQDDRMSEIVAEMAKVLLKNIATYECASLPLIHRTQILEAISERDRPKAEPAPNTTGGSSGSRKSQSKSPVPSSSNRPSRPASRSARTEVEVKQEIPMQVDATDELRPAARPPPANRTIPEPAPLATTPSSRADPVAATSSPQIGATASVSGSHGQARRVHDPQPDPNSTFIPKLSVWVKKEPGASD